MKVIKIGAIWCNSCLVMRPRWQKIEKEHPWLTSEYFDYDENGETVEKLSVAKDKLPVFIFYDDSGVETERLNGEPSEKQIIKVLEKLAPEKFA